MGAPRILGNDGDPQTQAQYCDFQALGEPDPISFLESQRTVSWLSVENFEFLYELHIWIVFRSEGVISLIMQLSIDEVLVLSIHMCMRDQWL